MHASSLALAIAVVACPGLPGQELLWTAVSRSNRIYLVPDFGDLDHDGCNDILLTFYDQVTTPIPEFRVLSGTSGQAIYSISQFPQFGNQILQIRGVGDFDGDGYPDFAVARTVDFVTDFVGIWSPHRGQRLLQVSGPWADTFGGAFTGRVDLDGDGLPDLVIASTHPNGTGLTAFDHFGTVLYHIQLSPQPIRILDVVGTDDLDGDGANEILVGGVDYLLGYTRGYLAVLSGRTGAILRVSFDPTPGDVMCVPMAVAGDLDHDGVRDYAVANFLGGGGSGRKIAVVFSAATGAILRLVQVPLIDGFEHLIADLDVDLDGVPDLITTSPGHLNQLQYFGQLDVHSGRDGSLLTQILPPAPVAAGHFAALANLGVWPDSPYPVIALHYDDATQFISRLEVWRLSPPGVFHSGIGCSSGTAIPTASLRRMLTAAGEHTDVILGSAPPGALAICVAAGAEEAAIGGSPLPLLLDPFGFPGCSLLVPPTASEARMVGSIGLERGHARIDVPFAMDTGGFGAAIQWLVLDAQTGAYAATPRVEMHHIR